MRTGAQVSTAYPWLGRGRRTPTFTSRRMTGVISSRRECDRFPIALAPWPSLPMPFGRSCWRVRRPRRWSAAAQTYRMAKRFEFARPIMRRRAGFDADQTWRKVVKERDPLNAAKRQGSRGRFVRARLDWPGGHRWRQKTFARSQMRFERATSRRDLSALDSI
jgi:hypothetical protein